MGPSGEEEAEVRVVVGHGRGDRTLLQGNVGIPNQCWVPLDPHLAATLLVMRVEVWVGL